MNIRTRISLALTALIVLLTLTTAHFSQQRAREQISALVAQQNQAFAARVAHELSAVLESQQAALASAARQFAARADRRASPADVQRWLADRPTLHALFDELILIDAKGIARGDYPVRPGRTGSDYADREWFQRTLASRAGQVSEPRIGQYLHAPLIVLTAPLLDARGEVRGLLAGIIPLDKPNLLGTLTQRKIGREGHFLLLSREHRFISHPDAARLLTQPPENPAFQRILAGFEGTLEGGDAAGRPSLLTVARMPATGWRVVLAVPRDEAYAPLDDLHRVLLINAAILLVLAIALIWLILGAALQPVARLQAAMTRAREQGFDQTAPLAIDGRDEMAALAAGFNEMARVIDTRNRQLAESEVRLSQITAALGFGVYVIDREGRIDFFNRNAEKLLGWSEAEVLGEDAHALLHHHHLDGRPYPVEECPTHGVLVDGRAASVEHEWLIHKSGVFIPVEIIATPLHRDGAVSGVVTAFHDISERLWAQERIRKQATHDSLTGLPNRRLCADRLEQAIFRARREQSSFAFLALDLDGFKNVNDKLGHAAGDRLLRQVAERLRIPLRQSDTVARQGGDEFAVILPHTDAAAASQVAGKLVASLHEAFRIGHEDCQLGVSIGIAVFPEHGGDARLLQAAADSAMYAAKEEGKNTFRLAAGAPPASAAAHAGPHVFIQWEGDFEIGNAEFDAQHREQADIFNRLEQALSSDAPPAAVRALFQQLTEHLAAHFAAEEAAMDRYGYPEANQHKAMHRGLLKVAPTFLDNLLDGEEQRQTLLAMRDWLMDHVTHDDRKLGYWLQLQERTGTAGRGQ